MHSACLTQRLTLELQSAFPLSKGCKNSSAIQTPTNSIKIGSSSLGRRRIINHQLIKAFLGQQWLLLSTTKPNLENSASRAEVLMTAWTRLKIQPNKDQPSKDLEVAWQQEEMQEPSLRPHWPLKMPKTMGKRSCSAWERQACPSTSPSGETKELLPTTGRRLQNLRSIRCRRSKTDSVENCKRKLENKLEGKTKTLETPFRLNRELEARNTNLLSKSLWEPSSLCANSFLKRKITKSARRKLRLPSRLSSMGRFLRTQSFTCSVVWLTWS